MRRLILWDIDGTLMASRGVGSAALEAAAARVAGLIDVPKVHMHGKTDRQILREIMVEGGVDPERAAELLPAAEAAAVEELTARKDLYRTNGWLLPGVREAVERLAGTDGIRQSLVTGNLIGNARIKLAVFELDPFLDIEAGAYGSDEEDRNKLVPLAVERVERLRGEKYAPHETWVIGDTDRDLGCAQVAGVRCMLVCTGHGGRDSVAHLEPDVLVEDLTDTDEIVRLLTSD
jgi:phosphoglycolate phosphatase-like HAD superfamily hydrolase